jgi:hypothetical protein
MGHGPHSSTLVVICVVNVYCHRVTTQLQLINISYFQTVTLVSRHTREYTSIDANNKERPFLHRLSRNLYSILADVKCTDIYIYIYIYIHIYVITRRNIENTGNMSLVRLSETASIGTKLSTARLRCVAINCTGQTAVSLVRAEIHLRH